MTREARSEHGTRTLGAGRGPRGLRRCGVKRSTPAHDAPATQALPSLGALLRRYLSIPAQSRPSSFFAFVRSCNPHVFSHHAHDRSDYHGHVWRAGGLFFCRGCTTVIVFTPLAFAAAILTRWPVEIPTAATASIFVLLLLLSLVPLPDGPRTPLHDLRRVALGCLLGSAAAYLLLCNDWVLRGVVVGVYVAVLAARRILRRS